MVSCFFCLLLSFIALNRDAVDLDARFVWRLLVWTSDTAGKKGTTLERMSLFLLVASLTPIPVWPKCSFKGKFIFISTTERERVCPWRHIHTTLYATCPRKMSFPFNGSSGFCLSIDMKEMSQKILNLDIKFWTSVDRKIAVIFTNICIVFAGPMISPMLLALHFC